MPVGGGNEAKLINGLHMPLSYAVANNGIYFIGELGLSFFDFATSRGASIASLRDLLPGDFAQIGPGPIIVSPDGNWILHEIRESPESDLMLVENFR